VPKLGCGYAVCVLLAAIGAAILFGAEAKWRSGNKTEAAIVATIGGVFCFAAIGLITPMQRAVLRAKERREREDARPKEPWTWEPAWLEESGIPQSGRRNGRAMLFIGIMTTLVSLPAVLALPREMGRGNFGILVALAFPAIGIVLLSIAVTDAFRRRKYGLARFLPAAVPVAHGGELAGMVLVNRTVVPIRPGEMSLECHRTTVTRHGNKRRQRDEVVSHQEREIVPADWVATMGESRVFVNLPVRGGVPTTMTPLAVDHPTYEWRLRVQVPTTGADFVAEFVLPVFDLANVASETQRIS
jgi:hypothetical protein